MRLEKNTPLGHNHEPRATLFLICPALLALLLLFHMGEARAGQTQTPTTPAPQPPAETFALPPGVLTPLIVGFRNWNGLLVVQAALDPTHRENFVIDTALNACTVTPEIGKQSNLPALPGEEKVMVFDKTYPAARAQIPKLEFTTFALSRIPVDLIDVFASLSPATAHRPDAPAGWLGVPFLAAFQVTFDYDKRFMILERPDAPLPKEKGAVVVPLQLSEGRIQVAISLPGTRPFPALLATSVPITMIPTKLAQQAKLKPLETIPILQPGGKEGKVARVVLPRLSVGRAEIQNANAVYITPDSPPEFNREMAILGLDFLRHFKVTINYSRRQVVFATIEQAKPKPADGTENTVDAKGN